jgi:hypothetical protein
LLFFDKTTKKLMILPRKMKLVQWDSTGCLGRTPTTLLPPRTPMPVRLFGVMGGKGGCSEIPRNPKTVLHQKVEK